MLDSLHPESTPNIHHLSLESPENEFNVEKELNLREQYQKQVEILRTNSLLETLSSGELGIKAINNQDYPLPTYDQVKASLEAFQAERVEARPNLLETKTKQGFKKLLLVPFGLKLQTQIEAYGEALKQHHSQGKLFRTKPHPQNHDISARVKIRSPIYQADEYFDADIDGKLVYYPIRFDSQNHRGQTKKQFLDSNSGWQILLVEERTTIPYNGLGQLVEGRPELEAGKTPNDYLRFLQENPNYRGEFGLTPEAWIILALARLEETNQVADDYELGPICYNVGAYFPALEGEGRVPGASWGNSERQVSLTRSEPAYLVNYFGARSAVRVPLIRFGDSPDLASSAPPLPEIRNF